MKFWRTVLALVVTTGCATVPEEPSADVPAVTRANGLLRLTRVEVETMLKGRGRELATASGKSVTRERGRYRIRWTEHAVPVITGKERVGQIDRYEGTTELERSDLEGLRKLMEEARIRAKGVRVPDDLASPTLVRCDARQCAIDLPLEATTTASPEVATWLRQALASQPVEAATSGGR